MSFRERVFIRHATLTARRRRSYYLTKSVINASAIVANDGDDNSATLVKYLRAQNALHSTFLRLTNKYPFKPNPFGTKVIRNGITDSVLSELEQHLH